ncbi:hypothetical protein [Gaoshiqia sediminis]|uniref:Uncharacterized protein n=1 Tax=Gaoshiqia sediminis TaxID=2986998 RepID=A0AA41Y9G7_9BACT|nr:hypothetical protein [Gaoshiqia sediminis]MCW0483418.1 hypothetical protein [Gaoshiqia sediminis]
MREKIKLEKIDNDTERDIILLLKEKEKCMMGDILMNLRLSYRRGKQHINSLLSKNWISNKEKAPYFTLLIDLD